MWPLFTPILTGLADRSHRLGPEVGLDTHVRDIVNLMKWGSLRDVVLVGHSYGGMVVSGEAEEMPEGAIQSIVNLDALYAPSGSSAADCAPRKTYALATAMPTPWREIVCGHGAMREMPQPAAELLFEAAL